jgi:hypothetical protein
MTEQRELSLEESMVIINQLDPMSPEDQRLLASHCMYSPHHDARLLAVNKLTMPALLVEVAIHEGDFTVSETAIEKLSEDSSLEKIAQCACKDKYVSILALRKIRGSDCLLRIAQTQAYTEVRVAAVGCINDHSILLQIAQSNTDPEVREAAVKRLGDTEEVALVAYMDPDTWVRRAAISTLTDPRKLILVITSNTSESIRKHALQRLIKICDINRIEPKSATLLVTLMNERALIALIIDAMEKSNCEWHSYCTDTTVSVLHDALVNNKIWKEATLLEKAIKQLFESRLDLRQAILSYAWTVPYMNRTIDFGIVNTVIEYTCVLAPAFA